MLRTVPPYLVGGFFTIFFPLLSWRFHRRNIFFIIGLPLVMAGYTIFLTIKEPQIQRVRPSYA
ncbi:hypothetical protein MPER_10101 [Moniliophthora perniciosa FA553]|nr:hypothetical protein MPER_10101 [Moniliophthora perniciosa FA553]